MGKYQKIAILGLLVSPFILLPLLPKETVASTQEKITSNIPHVHQLINYLSSENPDDALYFKPNTETIVRLYKQGFNHNGAKVEVASDVKYGHSIPMTEDEIRKHDAVKKKMADDERKKKEEEEAKKKAEEEEQRKKDEEERKKKEDEERKLKEEQAKKDADEAKKLKEETEAKELKEQKEKLAKEKEKLETDKLAEEKAKLEKDKLELEEEKKKLEAGNAGAA